MTSDAVHGHANITADVTRATTALLAGHLVAVPTETVYGLGALVGVAGAVERIFSVKDRPRGHPLIVHISSADALAAWARDVPSYASALAGALWPGPLTLVLPRSDLAPDAVTGGRSTVALRVPAHPVTLGLLRALDDADPDGAPHGLAAPSANRHGRVSPTTAAHVADDLGPHLRPGDLILDGGECTVGVESTIVDCTGERPLILRPGSIGAIEIGRVSGMAPGDSTSDADTGTDTVRDEAVTRSATGEVWPGGLASHYAPRAAVHLATQADVAVIAEAAQARGERVGLVAPGSVTTPPGVMRLAAPDDTPTYAARVYAALRSADVAGITFIVAVAPTDDSALATAIRDRLMRAAAPRQQA